MRQPRRDVSEAVNKIVFGERCGCRRVVEFCVGLAKGFWGWRWRWQWGRGSSGGSSGGGVVVAYRAGDGGVGVVPAHSAGVHLDGALHVVGEDRAVV